MSIASRVHLFPYRTQKLSSIVPKILGWKRPGKLGRCQHPPNRVDSVGNVRRFFVIYGFQYNINLCVCLCANACLNQLQKTNRMDFGFREEKPVVPSGFYFFKERKAPVSHASMYPPSQKAERQAVCINPAKIRQTSKNSA